MNSQCFVYFTRALGARESRHVARLEEELRGIADVHVLSYQGIPHGSTPTHAPATSVPVTVVSRAMLDDYFSDYPRKYQPGPDWSLMPGNLDLPQLAFRFLHPIYEHYWFSEDDVVYTGRMGALLSHFEATASDLLATSWRPMPLRWSNRLSLQLPAALSAKDWQPQICMLPLYRASRRFFDAVHAAYQQGLAGHHEITWPFVVNHADLVGCDVNDTGATFYTSNLNSEILSPGSFVYRPSRARPGRRPNTLYHPVKPLEHVLTYRLKVLYWRLASITGRYRNS